MKKMTDHKNHKAGELVTNCPRCNSENIYGITRITGYFSKTSMWNKGKIAELRDRDREANKVYFSKE